MKKTNTVGIRRSKYNPLVIVGMALAMGACAQEVTSVANPDGSTVSVGVGNPFTVTVSDPSYTFTDDATVYDHSYLDVTSEENGSTCHLVLPEFRFQYDAATQGHGIQAIIDSPNSSLPCTQGHGTIHLHFEDLPTDSPVDFYGSF